MLKRPAILFAPGSNGAAKLSDELARELRQRGLACAAAEAWSPEAPAIAAAADLLICIGGDGTVLRAARLGMDAATPILGVNMGRLGFLTEMTPRDLFQHIERVVASDWRIEERVMIRTDLAPGPGLPVETYHGLNDIVLSRRRVGRPVYVDLQIDRARVAVYRCDGIIVSTPTGSTGYSLSAGGPILAPTEHHLVVTPVSAHLALARSLVLQPESVVELRVTSEHGAVLSVDGQEDIDVPSECTLSVRLSEYRTRFVRFSSPSSFYAQLAQKIEVQLSSTMTRTDGA